ncbi:MAG: hypothetical protein IT450_12475 [Phycisphaerales bacterium]|nr:hypothetical protein [Phycisphaerales bacterium]
MKRQRSTYNLSFRSVLSTVAERLCTRLAAAAEDSSTRGMLMPLLTLGFLLSALSGVSRADQYWVAWEGNDFPENEGWTRIVDGVAPAERSLANGILTIDGLADRQIDDYYRINRPLNPEPGESFIMQWRFKVNELDGPPLYPYDPAVNLYSDDDLALALHFGVDGLFLPYERVPIPYEPAVFHEFEVRSDDMRYYQIDIDGSTVREGTFWEPTFQRSRVTWGDGTRGAASLTEWDYFRFGVVPEPGTSFFMLALLYGARATRQSRRMT